MPIFDQGYQHWKGTLSGHMWRWLAITRQGLRSQRKAWRVILLLLAAWVPAVVLVVVLALWGLCEQGSEGVLQLLQRMLPPGIANDPHAYRQAIWTIAYSWFFKFETFFIMMLVLTAGPNLISRDLRLCALPLYFSRPLRRLDYFLGKLGVIAALVAAVAVVPAVAAYVLGVCFSLDLTVVRDTWRLLPASILYGLVMVVSAGTLMLALSSLSRRSLYVGIAWVGVWVVGSAVAGVLGIVEREALTRPIINEEMAKMGVDASKHRMPMGGVWERAQVRVEKSLADEAPTNWRPLCSYTANLQRLGEALLNTDAAWVKLGEAIEGPRAAMKPFFYKPGAKPEPVNERRLADLIVPQYPWTWSAGVLAGLLGLSLWTLNFRVKSLDRLR